jgi:hypothetical protein
MVWFKVDDKLHSHPKTSNASLAAIGLWALAGSWCSDHLTDGRVPEHMIPSMSRGAVELADELVAAGFWVRVKGGYRFHQWIADSDGTKRNPSKKEVEEERRKKAEAGRKGGLASAKTRSKTQARAKAGASRLVEPPTRPFPSKEGSGDERAAPLGAPLVPPAVYSPPQEADLEAVRAKLRDASKARRAKVNGKTAGAFERLMAEPEPAAAEQAPEAAA